MLHNSYVLPYIFAAMASPSNILVKGVVCVLKTGRSCVKIC